ncbi:MAG: carboxypeptidase-like regulatory domain-containing protein, partial [Bacteroidales bacterium]|nr:carboxypeptidase-like regulatory domain-containing protein [Bacteroidales bacterium]
MAQVKITGTVVDEKGQPIEFATVKIAGTAIGVNTDTKGRYEISAPTRDTVMVVFSCLGYSTVRRQLLKPTGTV